MSELLINKDGGEQGVVRYERIVFIASLLLIAAGFVFLYWMLFPDIQNEAFVPLHYNVLSGIDRYGAWWRLFTIPAFGLVFFILNMVIAHVWLRKNRLLHAFLYSITLFTQIILFIAIIFVAIFLNSFYG